MVFAWQKIVDDDIAADTVLHQSDAVYSLLSTIKLNE
jgi:hypothetical protein